MLERESQHVLPCSTVAEYRERKIVCARGRENEGFAAKGQGSTNVCFECVFNVGVETTHELQP
jgi:hypothetical protein